MADMDENSLSAPSNAQHAAQVDDVRADRRHLARQIVSQQHLRLDRLEEELSDRLQQLADEIAREMAAGGSDEALTIAEAAHDARLAGLGEQIDQLRADLTAQEEALSRATDEVEQARVERAGLEQELRVRETLVAEAQGHAEHNRVESAMVAEQLADAQAQLAAAREQQEAMRRAADADRKAFEQEQSKSKSQRRRMARDIKNRHAAQVAQLEEQQAEIARNREALAQAAAEQERLVEQLRDAAGPRADDIERLHRLQQDHDSLSQQLAELASVAVELENTRRESADLAQQLKVRDESLAEAHDQAQQHQVELARANQQWTDAQAQLAAATKRSEEAARLAAELEQARIDAGRFEQELRVRDALVEEAQKRDEQNRVDLESMRRQLADADRLREAMDQANAEQQRLSAELQDATMARDAASEQLTRLHGQRDELAETLTTAEARIGELEAMAAELDQTRSEFGNLQQEIDARAAQLTEAQDRDEQSQANLAAAAEQITDVQTQLADAQAQLAAARDRVATADEKTAQLEKALLDAAKLEQELRVREALIAEAQTQQETTRVELASTVEQLGQTQAHLAAACQRQDELRHEAEAAQAAADAAASNTLDRDDELTRLREAVASAHAENERLADQLQEMQPGDGSVELDELRNQCDNLKKELATAEQRLAGAGEHEADAQDRDDQRHRFEMAVEELRNLKRVNAELEAKLKSGGGVAATAASGGLDWEAQKQRMLASLEADDAGEVGQHDEDAIAERQSIEGTIRITDQIVNQKDAEIDALRLRLEALSGRTEAPNSDAVTELLDGDDVIRKERDKLLQAQAEWREKIGKAEIEISIERAKIARERSALEEKERTYKAGQPSRPQSDAPNAPEPPPEKPPRGRWLSRLGLKDLDES